VCVPKAWTLKKNLEDFIPSLDILDNKTISHSLEGFSFQKDAFSFDDITFLNTTALDNDTQDSDSEVGDMGGDNEVLPMDFGGEPAGGEPVEDFFVGEQAVQDDYGGDDFGGPEPGDAEGGGFEPGQGNEPGAKANGAFEPFDPRRMPNERDLVMAMTDVDGGGGMMDYFDQNFLKNWAGPEHWKLRKPVRKGM
jgi:condensin complex subunit 2